MTDNPQTFALIPACGKSSRMGRPKLAMPLGGRPILEIVIDTLRQAEIENIVVVIGPHVKELVGIAEKAKALVCILSEETQDMRSTVEKGLTWIETHFEPCQKDSWLLIPGDHPVVEAEVVKLLLQARRSRPEFSIVVPTFEGIRGHPTLIGWDHVSRIRVWPQHSGLNLYLRDSYQQTLELSVCCHGVLDDLDTIEDYQKLMEWHKSKVVDDRLDI